MPSFAAFGNDLYTGRRSIDFVGRRRTWYLIAAVAVALSLLSLGVRGLNLGLEFRGGSEFRVTKATTQSESRGEDAVKAVVGPTAQVQVSKLGSDSVRIQTDRLTDAQTEQVRGKIASTYGVTATEVSTSFVGPQWGQDVSQKALTGLLVFLVGVALVIALYFRTWKMAIAAIVALIHDLILTVGIYALVGFEVTPASVIGFLTILGYSLYDTVVVFDKVRENTSHIVGTVKRTYGEAANLAVNQTLVRSINTSVVALLPVASILFIGTLLLGAGSLKDISLSLFVGIAAGTYSSIFIATPLLAHLREREPEMRAQAERVARKRAEAVADGATEGDPGSVLATVGAGSGPAEAVSAGAGSAPAGSTGRGGRAEPGQGTADEAAAARSQGQGQRQQPKRGGTPGRNRPGGRRR
jgi:preprotein translocase subunit SecF